MEEQIAEYLWSHGSKAGRAGCLLAAPRILDTVRAGASVQQLANYLYFGSLTPNLKSALDIATGVIDLVSKEGN